MPGFWIGLLLMILFGVVLRWLPPGGWGNNFGEHVRSLILPSFTQSLMTAALLMRNLRNSVVDITIMDFVDFARGKGISEARVNIVHVLRNGLISTITLLMMRMAWMLGGSVIIETVFSLPGMGKLLVDSIFGRDYAVVQVLVLLFSCLVIIMNLITDILYSFLDPRVSL
jgi:peptide/nickel transport system permease protein